MTKKELRKKYIDLRKSLSPQEREQMSVEIFGRIMENFDLNNKTISIFLPIQRFNEIITKPFMSLKSRFVLPVVDFENDKLKHIIFESKDQIKVNDWGIPEPTYGEELPVDLIDVVLVPLLAYDKKGFRVGYGKGFYDGFLSQCKPGCKFIGLSFFEPEETIEDTYEGDIPLHVCITPRNIYEFEI